MNKSSGLMPRHYEAPKVPKQSKEIASSAFGLLAMTDVNPQTRKPANPQTKVGFTLIELLITASIMALVSAAIISVFAGGLNVYNRVRSFSDARTDTLFSLEKMERSLRNACNISQIDFTGEAKKITFPAVVNPVRNTRISNGVNTAPGEKEGPGIGSLSYYIDNGTHYLVSEERDYSAATAREPPEGTITKLVPAEDIDFSYYYYDPQAKRYYWKDSWAEEKDEDEAKKQKIRVNTPLGVRVEIKYEDRGKPIALERTVFFPLAVSLHMAQRAREKKEKNGAR